MMPAAFASATEPVAVPPRPIAGDGAPPADYDLVRRALEHVTERYRDQPETGEIAARLGVTPDHLTRVFQRWAGLTPKAFLQAVTLDHARRLLAGGLPLLDAADEVGLSGPSRLHDLFVKHEAMAPGVYKARGEGLTLSYGFHASPFGRALVVASERGLAGVGFSDGGEAGDAAALADMQARWPRAAFVLAPDATAPLAARAFEPARWQRVTPLRVTLIGTDFEIRVWEALLEVPVGAATTYSDVAERIGRPTAARAVGAAVGRNPISFVVPCHRVLGRSGALTGYHWGLARKRAMMGWEHGMTAAHDQREDRQPDRRRTA